MYAQRFMELFKGLERAYGTYQLDGSSKYDGKKAGGKALTVRAPVTPDLWSAHLAGTHGLGIIPIRDSSDCFFGAIDIDVYPLDLAEVAQKIHDLKLPILPCRSKSGGVHGYVFFSEACPASLFVPRLKEFAAALAYGDPKKRETFPKQTQVLADRGDIGNWINMPYFGGEVTERFGVKLDGTRMSIAEFFEAAEAIKITPADLKKLSLYEDTLYEAPPCLQALCKLGFPNGSRNEALSALTTYYRKANPATWKEDTKAANQKFLPEPLPAAEVDGVINSMGKKDYRYPCSRFPLNSYCDPKLCVKRKHGIGQTTDMPALTALTKYDSDPPVWFIDVEGGGRMELTTEALQNQNVFQKRCMEVLHVMPPAIGKQSWIEMITQLMEKVHVVEAPAEATPKGQLIELLEQFLTGRAQGQTKEDLLTGRPWLDNGLHHFRLKAFGDFLKRQNFRELAGHQIASAIQEAGGKSHATTIKGRGCRYWTFPEFPTQKDGFEVPKYTVSKEPF